MQPGDAGAPHDTERARYHAEQPWAPFSESVLSWDVAVHDLMLNDRLRMTAYRKAIFEAVKPGDVVLDLGTGTGILGQWALEAGARRVFGIDLNASILAHAVDRIARAGFADRFEPINQLSYDVRLPRRVDVLISEILGNMADNEDFQPILQDAIRRFLAPGGTVLPRSATSYLVPVAARDAHARLCAGEIASFMSRRELAAMLRDNGRGSVFDLYYDCIVPRPTYLSRPEQLCDYRGGWEQPATYCTELAFAIERPERLTGFKAYFTADLTEATTLDISGDDIAHGDTSDSWKHAYLPIEEPIDVRRGDQLKLRFSRSYPAGGAALRQVYRWQGRVERSTASGLNSGPGNEVASGVVIAGEFDQCTGAKP
jgi:protein arginine N-methyltransferase 1